MKVLFVNHTSRVSGGERSLLELVESLPAEVSARLACPPGELARRVERIGVSVDPIPEIRGSLRLHYRHTSRAIVDIARSARALRRLSSEHDVDLVHANSIRAGLIAAIGIDSRGPRLLVHARDSLPAGIVSKVVLSVIGARATAVIANSAHTRESYLRAAPRAETTVIHSAVDVDRFDPCRYERTKAKADLGLRPSTLALGIVGQITPWKGLTEAVEATAVIKEGGFDPRLLVVGSPKFTSAATRYDNVAYLRSIERLVDARGLRSDVVFVGERDDVPEVLSGLDVLLAPSWEEPFGRSVIEGMAMELPVVATSVGGPREVIEEGVNGLLVPPRRPDLLAAAVAELAVDADRRRTIGKRARARVTEGFGLKAHVDQIIDLYRRTVTETG